MGVGMCESISQGTNWRLFAKMATSWGATLFVTGLLSACLFSQGWFGSKGWDPGYSVCGVTRVLVYAFRQVSVTHSCYIPTGVYAPSIIMGHHLQQCVNALLSTASINLELLSSDINMSNGPPIVWYNATLAAEVAAMQKSLSSIASRGYIPPADAIKSVMLGQGC